MILAVETATNVCSVAFENEGGEIFEKRSNARGSHSEKMFLFIKTLMKQHSFSVGDLSAMLVSEGPGSYTGLRIAASGIKGLLFGTQIPLYGVSTLASFAFAAFKKKPSASRIHAIIDARRKHLYHQLFTVNNNRLQAISEVETVPIKSLENEIQPRDIMVGTGIHRLDEVLVNSIHHFEEELISARSLIGLYQRDEAKECLHKVSAAAFDPAYYASHQAE